MKHLNPSQIRSLVLLSILGLMLATFGLASLAKWTPGQIPQGFQEQFGETWLASLPGGLFMPYYTIAVSETLAFLLFIVSLARLEFLPNRQTHFLQYGLILSLFIFVILAYGLRLTGQFQGTANAFFYFGATLVSLIYVNYATPKENT